MAELSACSLEFSPRVKLTFTHDEVTNCLTTVAPREPVDHRYQALFFTRTTAPSKEAQVALLEATLAIETSVLLRHEICYLMGQSGSPAAIPTLRRILHAEDEDEVTRHEAAEALAALEAPGLLEDLQAYEASRDTLPLLADTCKLALEGLKRKEDARVCGCQNGEKIQGGRFITTDPAKGDPTASTKDIPRLEATLMDESLALFDRYEAAFTLRNLGASGSLAAALGADASSACLRHELAFVLAQLEDEATAACLVAKLEDPCEHAVVRHEAAMALSAMDGSDAKAALLRNLKDPDPMVHESCKASLSTMAYWAAWEAEEARILGQP
jgi:deoxyhypusine monooxygenase